MNDRAMFREFGDLVRDNTAWIDAHEGGHFLDFIARHYFRATAMAIRRHIKDKDDSISLMRLMNDMKTHAATATRAFYDTQFPVAADDYEWRPGTFGILSDDGLAFSSSKIDEDITALTSLTANIESFADRAVAHLHKTSWNGSVTYGELFGGVDRLNELFCKYYVVLTGKGYHSLEATLLFNWKRIFSVPLVAPIG